MTKTILITGASRGFGKIWADAFLKRGDKVIATARNLETLNELVEKYGNAVYPIQLDINNREECITAVNKAKDHFGHIDVLINNAGYGLFGTVEETTEKEARNQMETNFFGVLWMTQAILPIMRGQKSGHIIQISSFLGLVTLPVLGLYNASKFAVEGLSESLTKEVKEFGINISLVEPNGFATDWAGASAFQTKHMDIYGPLKAAFKAAADPGLYGIPAATVEPMIKLIDCANPPLRLLLGKVAYAVVKQTYEERLQSFEKWKDISIAAHGK